MAPETCLCSHCCALYNVLSGSFSGDDESYQSQRYARLAPATRLHQRVNSQTQERPLKYISHARSFALKAKPMPSALLQSRFRQVLQDHSELDLLAKTDDEVHVENAPISARHIVTMVSAFWGFFEIRCRMLIAFT